MSLTKATFSMIQGSLVNVGDYGASGDGSDQTAAIVAANAAATSANKALFFPAGTYKITSTISSSARWVGEGVSRTIIKKGANIDMVNAGEGWQFENMTLDGDGSNYTGRGVVILNDAGRQKGINANIIDMDGYCIDFTSTMGGSQSVWAFMTIYRTNGTGAGREAVHIEDAVQAGAYPRKFVGIESNGSKFLKAGGCNGLFIVNSYIGNIEYSANSRGMSLVNSRAFTNETAVSMRGFGNSIVGCNVAPVITLESGTGECTIASNTYNQTVPIIDNSGNDGRNILDGPSITYTPTFTTSATAPSLGNGSLTGQYSRHGSSVTVTVLLTVGSTTSFGTGDLRFGIPVIPAQGAVAASHGIGVVTDSSPLGRTLCAVQVATGVNYAILLQSGVSGIVSGTSPYTLATGDTIRFTVTYPL